MGNSEIMFLLLLFSAGIACSFASNADVKRECRNSYEEGYQEGHDDGYDKGYDRGYEEGCEAGRWEQNEVD